jgi:hypothetical protein
MKLNFSTPLVCAIGLLAPNLRAEEAVQGKLDFKVIHAIANGPIIIEMTLTNNGEKPITLVHSAGLRDSQGRELCRPGWGAWVPLESKWSHLPPLHRYKGQGDGFLFQKVQLKPSESRSERLFLHLSYTRTSPGKFETKLRWEYDQHQIIIERPRFSREVQLEVVPIDSESGRRFIAEMTALFAKKSLSAEEEIQVVSTLRSTRLPEFRELYLKSLSILPETDGAEIVESLVQTLPHRDEAVRILTELLWNGTGSSRLAVCRYLELQRHLENERNQLRKGEADTDGRLEQIEAMRVQMKFVPLVLSRVELRSIRKPPLSLWIEARLFVDHRDEFTPRDKETLFDRIREQMRPLSERELKELLADLSSDQFALRQKASRKLIDQGERVVAALQRSSKAVDDPDLKRQIDTILNEIPKQPLNPELVSLIKHLANSETRPDSLELLKLLADGNRSLKGVQLARKHWQAIRK